MTHLLLALAIVLTGRVGASSRACHWENGIGLDFALASNPAIGFEWTDAAGER